MAIYHLSIKLVKRSQGKSAVAAAAYRSGEQLFNEYDGMVHDYIRKGGVVHSEIMLPSHAPAEFSDRSILWNSVEQIEKHSRAQLAREIEIALPNELSRAEQIKLVQNYCRQTFVDVGMCADFSIHDPKGKQQNTHAHILLTMRPLNKDGSWGDKQKKEYVLDNNGEKIYDPNKKQYKCGTVPTTDWNEQTKAEEWRQAWADFANRALAENHIQEKVDHRSYVQLFREDFRRELLQQDTAVRKAELAQQRKTLADAQKRIADLDTLVQRTYEDHVLGKLPDVRYLKLSAQYEHEQQEIAQLATKLEREIETEAAQMVDMDKFFVLADRYANLTELTAPIVNELISKIVVHSPEKRYSRKHVTIEVFFTYVGKIRVPINIENTEDVDIA